MWFGHWGGALAATAGLSLKGLSGWCLRGFGYQSRMEATGSESDLGDDSRHHRFDANKTVEVFMTKLIRRSRGSPLPISWVHDALHGSFRGLGSLLLFDMSHDSVARLSAVPHPSLGRSTSLPSHLYSLPLPLSPCRLPPFSLRSPFSLRLRETSVI